MNEVSTTTSSDTQNTQDVEHRLPPIECAPWCEDGTGHTNRDHPDDQYCSAGYQVMELTREVPEQITPGGAFYRRELSVQLYRDPFSVPYVSSWLAGAGGMKLTLAEARQYATQILHLADMADR
jgi:hypothetical protein